LVKVCKLLVSAHRAPSINAEFYAFGKWHNNAFAHIALGTVDHPRVAEIAGLLIAFTGFQGVIIHLLAIIIQPQNITARFGIIGE